jgi:hypothetical protein
MITIHRSSSSPSLAWLSLYVNAVVTSFVLFFLDILAIRLDQEFTEPLCMSVFCHVSLKQIRWVSTLKRVIERDFRLIK